MSDQKHFFGSSETERKLSCLREYLQAYSIALKHQNFARVYIDAFAGTGNRTETRAVLPMMTGEEPETVEITTPGSARIALETEPKFNLLVFIEQDKARFTALRSVIDEYPGSRAHAREGDANEIVQKICAHYRWKTERMRGVVFLDPFGMEVSWKTVEAIAKTEALDCWYFFPLSGLYRNASRDPDKLDASKIKALTRVLGTDSWRTEWYEEPEVRYDLFGDPIGRPRRAFTVDRIEDWVRARLETVFKGVVMEPMRLYHSNGAPMASLFFAVSNPSRAAVRLAQEIAGHILKIGISSHVRPR